MATLVARKRTDGTTGYKIQWRLGGARGGAWQSETFDDRRAALKFQAQVEANGHRWPEGWVKGVGFVSVPADPEPEVPLLEFGTAYIRRLTSAGPHTHSTYLRQTTTLAARLTEIKGVPPTIQNVTSDDDRDWIVTRRNGGASPKTIANEHGLLSAIFKSAVRKGLIPSNPCEGVKLPAIDDDTESDDDKSFLTEDEFAILVACVDESDRDYLKAAVGTGCRKGELDAFKVKDYEPATEDAPATLAVRRAWKWNGRGEFKMGQFGRHYLGKPKTKESRRRITLAPLVAEVFERAIADKGPEELIFGTLSGGRLEHGNWYQSRWQPAVRAAKKKGLTKSPRFHDLRHTHAAWLISAGVPLPVIQKRLGHKSIQITVDVYGGLLFQTHQVADLAIERALGGAKIVTVPDDRAPQVQAATELHDDEEIA
jgi:integrase